MVQVLMAMWIVEFRNLTTQITIMNSLDDDYCMIEMLTILFFNLLGAEIYFWKRWRKSSNTLCLEWWKKEFNQRISQQIAIKVNCRFPKLLAYLFTLYQSGGADYARNIGLFPPIFMTFLHNYLCKSIDFQSITRSNWINWILQVIF